MPPSGPRWLLPLLALSACQPGTDTSTTDTDTDTDVTTDTDTDCVLPLSTSGPATYAAAVADADTTCITAWPCADGSDAAAGVLLYATESYEIRFFDAGGAVVGGYLFDDGGGLCGSGDQHTAWLGQRVDDCTIVAAAGSVGCALPPAALAAPAETCTVDPLWGLPRVTPATTWTDVQALDATSCFGTADCTIGERTVHLTYRTQDYPTDLVDVYDTDGTRIAGYEGDRQGLLCGLTSTAAWVGEAFDACLDVTFTPSSACGVPTLP